MRTFNDPLFDAVPMSGSLTTGSSAVPLPFIEGFSVQALMTSIGPQGVTGTLKLQASLDRAPNINSKNITLTNWTDISGSTATVQFSGSHSVVWNVADAYFPHVRLVYTNTGGSGSLTARIAGKGA